MKHLLYSLTFFSALLLYSIPSTAAKPKAPHPSAVQHSSGVWILKTEKQETIWYDNLTKKSDGPLLKGIRNGDWKFWYSNGNLKGEGKFVNGKKDGEWKLFSANGSIQSAGIFKDDTKNGNWKIYFPDGKLRSEGVYHGGLKSGVWKEYYENGKLFYEGTYAGDVAHGPWTFYFKDGQLYQSGSYNREKKVGIWKICVQPGVCESQMIANPDVPSISNIPADSQNEFGTDEKDPSSILDSLDKKNNDPSSGKWN